MKISSRLQPYVFLSMLLSPLGIGLYRNFNSDHVNGHRISKDRTEITTESPVGYSLNDTNGDGHFDEKIKYAFLGKFAQFKREEISEKDQQLAQDLLSRLGSL